MELVSTVVVGEKAKVKCLIYSPGKFINIINTPLKSGRRWIISNFSRHMKSHAAGDSKTSKTTSFLNKATVLADCGLIQ